MARTPTPAAVAVSLVAVEPVEHNGARIAPGEPFEADPAAAEALVAAGAATLAEAAAIQQPLA